MNFTSSKKPLTEHDKKAILRLREAGFGYEVIAKRLDKGKVTVKNFLIKEGKFVISKDLVNRERL